ncbi:hypothetical protein BCR34DRAFT_34254 [Clohesyomyces aquaticus]|uniref:Uncharacterized protein n=1 Tax=Clohesyomyces aquaticus TaxID=1231657 RepID=A0A1Y1Z8K5_9PLEO|nr:hypothetical protein BCR34DRAFT_34254 [Clohesyomyces aquaticus]
MHRSLPATGIIPCTIGFVPKTTNPTVPCWSPFPLPWGQGVVILPGRLHPGPPTLPPLICLPFSPPQKKRKTESPPWSPSVAEIPGLFSSPTVPDLIISEPITPTCERVESLTTLQTMILCS